MLNIYEQIPKEFSNELFDEILKDAGPFRLERIVSSGHSTPEDEWLDQQESEWVILLKGSSGILIEGESEAVVLKPGDYLRIPAYTKHRVQWTDAETETVWLALHY
jgi:cupin 2 domain-containing protein